MWTHRDRPREISTELNLAFSETATLDEQTMRKFRIEMKVNQEIDVQKVEPMMVKRELKQNPMADTIQIDAKGQLKASVPQSVRNVNLPASGH